MANHSTSNDIEAAVAVTTTNAQTTSPHTNGFAIPILVRDELTGVRAPTHSGFPRPSVRAIFPTMPSRIVTYVHRPRRAPRKKAAAMATPAIVNTANSRGRKGKVWVDDGSPSDPEMQAWLNKAKWGRGPSG
jgi:hypothetical protein